MIANRTLLSPTFAPPVPGIDIPVFVSPLARSMQLGPTTPKLRIRLDPNMVVGEDDDTLDIADYDADRLRPAETMPRASIAAFVALLAFAYAMAMTVTLALTGAPALKLLHHLHASIAL